jgi:ferredoxin-NADP reductase
VCAATHAAVAPAAAAAATSTAHTAYADRLPAFEKAGVKVLQVFSDGAADGAKYVQDVFGAAKALEGVDKAGVGAVLCGHKDMCNAVKDMLTAEGVDADKVLLNF